jgi:tRNA(Met) C34 N-acetyltransferase TmcA
MSEKLTLEEQACNFKTMEHIHLVARGLHSMIKELLDRADKHDASKLTSPEVEAFTEFTPKLARLTFGSPEYYAQLNSAEFQTAITHHYCNNRHHPEAHKSGIDDMNIVDIAEMLSDWYASSKRQYDGNLRKSIEKNADRFGMSPQLRRILENSIDLFE